MLRVLGSTNYFQAFDTECTRAHSIFTCRDTVSTANLKVYWYCPSILATYPVPSILLRLTGYGIPGIAVVVAAIVQ